MTRPKNGITVPRRWVLRKLHKQQIRSSPSRICSRVAEHRIKILFSHVRINLFVDLSTICCSFQIRARISFSRTTIIRTVRLQTRWRGPSCVHFGVTKDAVILSLTLIVITVRCCWRLNEFEAHRELLLHSLNGTGNSSSSIYCPSIDWLLGLVSAFAQQFSLLLAVAILITEEGFYCTPFNRSHFPSSQDDSGKRFKWGQAVTESRVFVKILQNLYWLSTIQDKHFWLSESCK